MILNQRSYEVKCYDELNTKMVSIQQQMVEPKKNERANVQKK